MADPEITTLTITREAAALIEESVAGEFASPSDAIRGVFLGWKAQRGDLGGYSPDELDRLIDEGLASGPSREVDWEGIKRQARRRASLSTREASRAIWSSARVRRPT